MGEELTYDYGEGYIEGLGSQTSQSTDGSDMERSVQLTPGSVAPTIMDESNKPLLGMSRFEHTVGDIERKAEAYDRLDVRPDLGFLITSPNAK